MAVTVDEWHEGFAGEDRAIVDRLRSAIEAELPEAEAKVWHAHPVWFLKGNPIVGYLRLKDAVRLMFWSGQSFEARGLRPTGSFKAAEARYRSAAEIDAEALALWLAESREVQWDYADIARRKGKLVRL